MKRLQQTMNVTLEFFDDEGEIIVSENTAADIVAKNGVATLCYQAAAVGDIINFKVRNTGFETAAVIKSVRNSIDDDGQTIYRLVLEFVGTDWQNQWQVESPTGPLELFFDDFKDAAKDLALLMQIVIGDMENGELPDEVFLRELQENIDNFRQLLFRVRKA